MLIHAPFCGVFGTHFPQMMSLIVLTPKRTVLGRNHVIWAINRENRSHGSSWACEREKRTGQDRKKSHKRVIFHLFVEQPPLKRWFWMGLTTVQRYCAACDVILADTTANLSLKPNTTADCFTLPCFCLITQKSHDNWTRYTVTGSWKVYYHTIQGLHEGNLLTPCFPVKAQICLAARKTCHSDVILKPTVSDIMHWIYHKIH